MIRTTGTPCLFDGSFECFLTDDAKPITRPAYYNYEVVYITRETMTAIEPMFQSEFGPGFHINPEEVMSWLKQPENIEEFGELVAIEFEGQTLYPDISGWIVK